jgi:hypothetical protein
MPAPTAFWSAQKEGTGFWGALRKYLRSCVLEAQPVLRRMRIDNVAVTLLVPDGRSTRSLAAIENRELPVAHALLPVYFGVFHTQEWFGLNPHR